MTLPDKYNNNTERQKMTWAAGTLCHFKDLGLMCNDTLSWNEHAPEIWREIDDKRHELFEDAEDALKFVIVMVKATGDMKEGDRMHFLEAVECFYTDRERFNKVIHEYNQKKLEKLYAM